MSYGPNLGAVHQRAAYHVDRLLRGTQPADLSIEQAATFELVINMKTAKALRLPPQRAPHLGQVLFSVVNNERLDHLGRSHFALLGGDASFSALGGRELPDHARRRPDFLV